LFGEKQEQPEEGVNQEQHEQVEQEEERETWVLYEVEPLEDADRDGRRKAHVALIEKKLRGEECQDEEVSAEQEEAGLEPDIEEYEKRVQQYRRLRRDALLESVQALREGRWLYSRRIIGIWSYQRERLRLTG
jgi:hypothetical protein